MPAAPVHVVGEVQVRVVPVPRVIPGACSRLAPVPLRAAEGAGQLMYGANRDDILFRVFDTCLLRRRNTAL